VRKTWNNKNTSNNQDQDSARNKSLAAHYLKLSVDQENKDAFSR
jgi:hypothetical protein